MFTRKDGHKETEMVRKKNLEGTKGMHNFCPTKIKCHNMVRVMCIFSSYNLLFENKYILPNHTSTTNRYFQLIGTTNRSVFDDVTNN